MFVAWKTQVLLAMVIRLEEVEEAWPAREEEEEKKSINGFRGSDSQKECANRVRCRGGCAI